jgi:hypothetical protein
LLGEKPKDSAADAHLGSAFFDGNAKSSLIPIDDSSTHITGSLSDED